MGAKLKKSFFKNGEYVVKIDHITKLAELGHRASGFIKKHNTSVELMFQDEESGQEFSMLIQPKEKVGMVQQLKMLQHENNALKQEIKKLKEGENGQKSRKDAKGK